MTDNNDIQLLHKLYHATLDTAKEGKTVVRKGLEGAFYDCSDILDRRVAESPVLVVAVDGFAAALTGNSPHRSEDKDYRRSSWLGRAAGYACAPGAYLAGGVVSKTVSAASGIVSKGEELFGKVFKRNESEN